MTQYNVILIHIIIKLASRYFKTNLCNLYAFVHNVAASFLQISWEYSSSNSNKNYVS
jgi:hypothetical protein